MKHDASVLELLLPLDKVVEMNVTEFSCPRAPAILEECALQEQHFCPPEPTLAVEDRRRRVPRIRQKHSLLDGRHRFTRTPQGRDLLATASGKIAPETLDGSDKMIAEARHHMVARKGLDLEIPSHRNPVAGTQTNDGEVVRPSFEPRGRSNELIDSRRYLQRAVDGRSSQSEHRPLRQDKWKASRMIEVPVGQKNAAYARESGRAQSYIERRVRRSDAKPRPDTGPRASHDREISEGNCRYRTHVAFSRQETGQIS